MSLKKFLRRLERKPGQASVEYFVLLALITAFAILSTSTLFSHTRTNLEDYTNAAANAMAPVPD